MAKSQPILKCPNQSVINEFVCWQYLVTKARISKLVFDKFAVANGNIKLGMCTDTHYSSQFLFFILFFPLFSLCISELFFFFFCCR